MPKIVIKFESPESNTAALEQNQPVAYLSMLATLIEKGQIEHNLRLTDSCVILEIAREGECDIKAYYGNLRYPDVQLPMLADYLKAVCFSAWLNMPAIGNGLNQVGQMVDQVGKMVAILLKQHKAKEQKIVIPGMPQFGNNNFMS